MTDASPIVALRDRIAAYIIGQIMSGIWLAGERIPSESEFAAQFGASRMTVHHALRDLTQRGFLRRRKGSGSFVAEPRPYVSHYDHHDIIDEIEGRALPPHLPVVPGHQIVGRIEAMGGDVAAGVGITSGIKKSIRLCLQNVEVHRLPDAKREIGRIFQIASFQQLCEAQLIER